MRSPIHRPIAAAAAAAAILVLAAADRPGRADDGAAWTVDREKSTFTVDVFKAGVLSGLAHDHTFDVRRYEATIVFDPAAPEKGSITLEVEAASLALRESEADADDQAEIEQTMRETVLEVDDHPKITFRSARVRRTGGEGGRHELSVEGELALHGKKRKMTITATVGVSEAGALTAEGKVRFDQSDFDIEPYSAFLGAVAVKDEVLISFSLHALPRS